MLRYFYLLALLISMSFCYEHISRHHFKHKQFGRQPRKNEQLTRQEYKHKLTDGNIEPVQKNINDKEQTEIDVASFIQNPDYTNNDEGLQDEGNNQRRLTRKYYNEYEFPRGVNRREMIKINEDQGYLNLEKNNSPELNYNFDSIKDDMDKNDLYADQISNELNSKSLETQEENRPLENYPNDKPLVINQRQGSETKSSIRNFRLPFFFRNGSVFSIPSKSKSDKIRKMFCLTCNFKNYDNRNEVPKKTESTNSNNRLLLDENRIDKRSFEERICPACKKKYKFIDRLRRRNKRNRIFNKFIHNSRQPIKNSQNSISNDLKTNKEDGSKKNANNKLNKGKCFDDNNNIRKIENTQRVKTSKDIKKVRK